MPLKKNKRCRQSSSELFHYYHTISPRHTLWFDNFVSVQLCTSALLDAVLISDAAASLVQYSQIPTSLDDGAYREYPYASMEAEREYSRRRELGFEREYEYLERERGLEYAAREREMHYERERDRERQMNGEAERDRRMERLEREREMERERQRALERELEKEEREKEMLSQRDDMEHTFYANGGQAAPRRRHGMTKSREYGELRAWRAQPEVRLPLTKLFGR